MRRRSRILAPLLALAAVAAVERPARAQELQLPPPPEAPGTARPPAPDLLGGRVLISPRFGLVVPLGSYASGFSLTDVASTGMDIGGSVGIGLGRNAELQVLGSYQPLGSKKSCPECTARMYDVGLGLVFHAVQALAFDPWVSYGAAFRDLHVGWAAAPTVSGSNVVVSTASTLPGAQPSIDYKGFDFARVAFGGDFRPVRFLGVGAYFETDVGSLVFRPGTATGASAYVLIGVGARITLGPLPSRPLEEER